MRDRSQTFASGTARTPPATGTLAPWWSAGRWLTDAKWRILILTIATFAALC